MSTVFPGAEWSRVSPREAGLDPDRLARATAWLDDRADRRGDDHGYRFAVVRGGRLVIDQNRSIDRDEKLATASTWKSMLSNVLGIAIAEGKLPSADAEVADYWPAFLDVPEGTGPKPGRHAFAKDARITFRHLISNTSGYMKPGEDPGTVFHYQSWGMNVLSHAVASLYGFYDVGDPEGSDGFMRLVREKIAAPIGAAWEYESGPMDLHPAAKQEVFAFGTRVRTSALDLARAGWLWCNEGSWAGREVVPAAWMRASTRVAPTIVRHCEPEDHVYGQGFWSNSEGRLWPDLPRDGFHSWGAGGHYAAVFPGEELVIVQNPDPLGVRGGAGANPELIGLVLAACR